MSKPVFMITGTSRGIGRELARQFVEKGYRVVGCSRSVSALEVDGYTHYQVDLTDENQVREWVKKVKRECGSIDVLVCNNGLVASALLMSMTSGQVLDSFIHSNFSATYFICREVSKTMLMQKQGRIITIASTMLGLHEPGTSAYSATKAAVVEMTKVLAREVAEHGITCNVVAPSLVVTESTKDMGEDWKKRMLELQTLKRPLEVHELVHVIDFLASPKSAFITGQVIGTCMVN